MHDRRVRTSDGKLANGMKGRAGKLSTRILDVFNRRCLRNILGISWKDHVSNEDLLERTKVDNLHDTVDKRRRRFVGHVLRLPSARPASAAVQWTPEGGKRRRGRPEKTWHDGRTR